MSVFKHRDTIQMIKQKRLGSATKPLYDQSENIFQYSYNADDVQRSEISLPTVSLTDIDEVITKLSSNSSSVRQALADFMMNEVRFIINAVKPEAYFYIIYLS